ncbi:MAG: prolyl oligopeptidase family serine peptidase, partial [Planctomycetes bacterium]|nr:prolyl oligopeptidase family serine peptidase [Planctomycetota bacterium]
TGKLLIMHGMVDDNVHPSNAWQLIHALQQAGKPFEMMLFPRSGHGAPATARRLRWTFLYRHLIEEATERRSDEATEGGLGSDEVTE